jgi:hypothetical protein
LAVQHCLDEAGVDIEDPVGESILGTGGAVVQLVGMEDVALAGQAVLRLATVMKGLDTGELMPMA